MDENTHQVDEAKLTVLSFDIGHKSTEPLPVPTQTEVEVPSTEGSTLIQVNCSNLAPFRVMENLFAVEVLGIPYSNTFVITCSGLRVAA
jgi:hypothetical protein